MSVNFKERLKRKWRKQPAIATGEIYINTSACDGCGRCVMICAQDVLSLREISDEEVENMPFLSRMKVMVKGKNKAFAMQPHTCIRCSLCEDNCHEQAIRIGR